MTLEDYHNSRWIAEPFHLFDCTLVSNGGVAVIVTTAERARDLKQPPAYIWGMGQGHPGDPNYAGWDLDTRSGAVISKDAAYATAGVGTRGRRRLRALRLLHLHRDGPARGLGFCAKGEGGPFVADGKTGAGRLAAR